MDDGLLLNLSIEDGSSALSKQHQVKEKGGRWTDRQKARQATKRKTTHVNQESPRVTSHHSSNVTETYRPLKRPRRIYTTLDGPVHLEDNRTTKASRTHSTVISSLFTSNPTIPDVAKESTARPIATPSNAPLKDASNFADLNIDPLLVSHLLSRMDLKKPTAIQQAAIPILVSKDPSISHRDVFLQSQTGSGKTLAFLLPIIQDLLPLSQLSHINRAVGTLAMIIVPTRELAKQVSDVLESLLQMRLRPQKERPDDDNSPRLTRWLVSGLLSGGATRSHEKARLRKGMPIIVATPGRLLDHLQHTSSFSVEKCRWLVLDEADRLMDLGFKETIEGILKSLDGRRNLAIQVDQDGMNQDIDGWDRTSPRRTVLCSATIRDDIKALAGQALRDPITVSSGGAKQDVIAGSSAPAQSGPSVAEVLSVPSQLSQKYFIVPLKLRLVSLVALIRSLLAGAQPIKVIVFMSTTDSVDFHWSLLGGVDMKNSSGHHGSVSQTSDADTDRFDGVALESTVLPHSTIIKLHGGMELRHRQAAVKQFRDDDKKSAVLLSTSVASRGLDLPLVRAVIQYDLPTESGATEYVHRIGRTARAGLGGEAYCFVAPTESEWVNWLESKLNQKADQPGGSCSLQAMDYKVALQRGFGGVGLECQRRATDVQLALERFVLGNRLNADLARQAFTSSVRAYATHPSEEKHIFHVRSLHLGHLAKSFALREAPSMALSHTPKPTKQSNSAQHLGKRKVRPGDKTRNVNTAEEFQVAS